MMMMIIIFILRYDNDYEYDDYDDGHCCIVDCHACLAFALFDLYICIQCIL